MINGAVAVVVWFVTLALAVPFGMWAVWPTAEKHGYRRGYTEGHKRADREQPALPAAGRLAIEYPLPAAFAEAAADPGPGFRFAHGQGPHGPVHASPWVFSGGWDEGPPPVSAEYELLTQTACQKFTRSALDLEGYEICAEHEEAGGDV